MNRKEWLLTQLVSEANVIAHAASKALQFGLDEDYSHNDTPRSRLRNKLNDLAGTVMLLEREGVLEYLGVSDGMDATKKIAIIEAMYEHAVKIGAVTL